MKKTARILSALLVTILASASISAIEYVPGRMNPGAVIQYDESMNMTVIDEGTYLNIPNVRTKGVADNTPRNIKLSDDLSTYSDSELAALYDAKNNDLHGHYDENKKIVASPNSTVVYDGMGTVFKIYNSIEHATYSTRWTYPANDTYYYGTWEPKNWIRIQSDYVMGQGYVTYYYGALGYHGDDLDQMEEDDPNLNICATKMDYDRPNRGQKIKLRVLDSNWADTNDVYYLYKYDVGGLPEAIIDIRERLFSEITDITNGIFHGRYFYDRVPLTDPY